ncbi:MAG: hypothetical protein HQ498_03990 [Pseudohongiella sp.]|nr:hypothetical protein [Pseudohongiella sp.]
MKVPVIKIENEEAHFDLRTIGTRQVKEQNAYADLGGKHPLLIKFNLPESQTTAYPVGQYSIDVASYRIGKYGSLEINPFELKLLPLVTPASLKSDLKQAS